MTDDRGSVTIWMVGLAALMAVVSGLAVDAWHLLDERRALTVAADAAAVAATSAVDRTVWSTSGTVVLLPEEACALAAGFAGRADGFVCRVDGATARVELVREVPLVVLSLVDPAPVVVSAWSEAEARALPTP